MCHRHVLNAINEPLIVLKVVFRLQHAVSHITKYDPKHTKEIAQIEDNDYQFHCFKAVMDIK